MRFYIASTIKNKNQVRLIIIALNKNGHDVTVDWTDSEKIHEDEREENIENMRSLSLRDYDGIHSCDVFAMLSEPSDGRSMYVELGIAIACRELTGNPKIYIIGGKKNQSIFYYHPTVCRVDDINQLFQNLALNGVNNE